MKLRFEVNQAESFRQGVNVSKSIVTIEVDPSALKQEERNLIADRLDGIDVCQLDSTRTKQYRTHQTGSDASSQQPQPLRIEASLPTFESMMEAIRKEESELKKVGDTGDTVRTALFRTMAEKPKEPSD